MIHIFVMNNYIHDKCPHITYGFKLVDFFCNWF